MQERASSPSNQIPMCSTPAMAERTYLPQTYSLTCPFQVSPTKGGPETSRSSLVARRALPRCRHRPLSSTHRRLGLGRLLAQRSGRRSHAARIDSRRHTTALIFHSDRGSQQGSRAFRNVLRLAAMRQSCPHESTTITTPGPSRSLVRSKLRC